MRKPSLVFVALLIASVFLGLSGVKAQETYAPSMDETEAHWRGAAFVILGISAIIAVFTFLYLRNKPRQPRRRSHLKASAIASCLLPLVLLPEHAEKTTKELWTIIFISSVGALLLIYALRRLRRGRSARPSYTQRGAMKYGCANTAKI